MSRDFVDNIVTRQYAPVARTASAPAKDKPSGAFADLLTKVQQSTAEPRSLPLKISAHAATRMQQRGLQLSSEDWIRVGQAVAKAEQKGAKDAYVMYGNAGLIVNVPNKTVVTAMVNQEENLVTNVDSVVTVPRLDR